MKINRPLFNPSSEADEEDLNNQIEYSNEDSKDQLYLNISKSADVSIKQRVNTLKMFLQKRQAYIEVSMLWKTPVLPFTITSLAINIFLLIFVGIIRFDKLPPKIPFIYNAIEKHWEQSDKLIIFFVGFSLLIIESITILMIREIFKKDRRTALTISSILILFNFLILICILQFYSLIT